MSRNAIEPNFRFRFFAAPVFRQKRPKDGDAAPQAIVSALFPRSTVSDRAEPFFGSGPKTAFVKKNLRFAGSLASPDRSSAPAVPSPSRSLGEPRL